MDLEAADYVMSESEEQHGLVVTSYRLQMPYSTAGARAPLPALGGKTLLAESRWWHGRVVGKLNGMEDRETLPEARSVETRAWTCAFRGHRGKPLLQVVGFRSPHIFQFRDLKTTVKAGGVGVWSNQAYAIS